MITVNLNKITTVDEVRACIKLGVNCYDLYLGDFKFINNIDELYRCINSNDCKDNLSAFITLIFVFRQQGHPYKSNEEAINLGINQFQDDVLKFLSELPYQNIGTVYTLLKCTDFADDDTIIPVKIGNYYIPVRFALVSHMKESFRCNNITTAIEIISDFPNIGNTDSVITKINS